MPMQGRRARSRPETKLSATARRREELAGVHVDESTAEAIADCHYWVAHGYCFSLTHTRRKDTPFLAEG
jgi:hypothetical protein